MAYSYETYGPPLIEAVTGAKACAEAGIDICRAAQNELHPLTGLTAEDYANPDAHEAAAQAQRETETFERFAAQLEKVADILAKIGTELAGGPSAPVAEDGELGPGESPFPSEGEDAALEGE